MYLAVWVAQGNDINVILSVVDYTRGASLPHQWGGEYLPTLEGISAVTRYHFSYRILILYNDSLSPWQLPHRNLSFVY